MTTFDCSRNATATRLTSLHTVVYEMTETLHDCQSTQRYTNSVAGICILGCVPPHICMSEYL